MSFYGIDGVSSDSFFDSYFTNDSTSKKQQKASTLDSLMGGAAGSIGDYSLIQSGAYKKLLSSYYKTISEKDKKEDSTTSMLTVKGDAEALNKTASALVDNKKLFESLKDKDGKEILDEKGNKTYDREGIKKALKSFVDEYNALLDSTGKLENTSALSNTLRLIKTVDTHKNLLQSVGIKVGSDNKLTIDEEKLDTADISKLSTLFNGRNSLADKVAGKTAQLYNIANSNAYTNTRAATYTFDGTTSTLGKTNTYLDGLI